MQIDLIVCSEEDDCMLYSSRFTPLPACGGIIRTAKAFFWPAEFVQAIKNAVDQNQLKRTRKTRLTQMFSVLM